MESQNLYLNEIQEENKGEGEGDRHDEDDDEEELNGGEEDEATSDEEEGGPGGRSKKKKNGKITRFIDFHGEVMKARLNGLFDVAFDDGTILRSYPRSKIRFETDRDPRTEPISHIAAVNSANRKKNREKHSRLHMERQMKKVEEKADFDLRQRKLGVRLAGKKLWIDDHPPALKALPAPHPRPSFHPTQQIPPEFHLVYYGPDTNYACEVKRTRTNETKVAMM